MNAKNPQIAPINMLSPCLEDTLFSFCCLQNTFNAIKLIIIFNIGKIKNITPCQVCLLSNSKIIFI